MIPDVLPIVAGLGLPMGMALACLWRPVRAQALGWLWIAPLPALLAALLGRGGDIVIAPDPMRLTLAIDDVGAMLLGGAALLWAAAGFYAAALLKGQAGAGGFAVWWLLTLTGSLGTFVVADLTSFYLAFSVASLAAYGLVTFEASDKAARAGRVYMVLALLGEALLLLGLVMLATGQPGGNPLIRDAVAALGATPLGPPALILLTLGFALKMGLVPLHVWMPLAHPVAPMPASAVLSGIIVKAGVIGLIRFLPPESGLSSLGGALIAIGLFTAFYAAAMGLTQRHAKTVLAYSTVSQMGLVAAVVGAGLSSGAADTMLLAAFYALHHLLVKGALFLGVGVVAAGGRRHRRVLIPVMGVLALSLAGLPLTSGALAKYAIKPLFLDEGAAMLATLTAAGSTVLMLHCLMLLRRLPLPAAAAAPPWDLVLPFAVVSVASQAAAWTILERTTGVGIADMLSLAVLWTALWPMVLGCAIAVGLFWRGRRLPSVPEGDVIVLAERVAPLLRTLGRTVESGDAWLRRWPVASAMLVILGLVLSVAI
jgi:formate hydrogenlyase subunit 3/multisubunit Na+/H+ antiporter MnhD subunit